MLDGLKEWLYLTLLHQDWVYMSVRAVVQILPCVDDQHSGIPCREP